jgi:Peptidase propeptide and YPEB domain
MGLLVKSRLSLEAYTTTQSLPGRLAILGLMCILATGSFAYTGRDLAGTAKVSIEQARSIAVRARPCAITSEELKKEKGGSGSRYSFGIKNGKVFYEVVVDAETGKVLENLKEGRNPD